MLSGLSLISCGLNATFPNKVFQTVTITDPTPNPSLPAVKNALNYLTSRLSALLTAIKLPCRATAQVLISGSGGFSTQTMAAMGIPCL